MTRVPTGAVLAGAALALAALAPLAGSDAEPGGSDGTGVVELTEELATGEPFVDAVTLGEWIRARREVRILDVRADSGAVVRFTVPTATHVPLDQLPEQVEDSVTVVVYDDGSGEAFRAWLLLRRLGHPDVRILRHGVLGWIEGVVQPVLPADSPEEKARYRRVAAVSRYFGGLPRIGTPPARDSGSADEAVQLLSRRGCY